MRRHTYRISCLSLSLCPTSSGTPATLRRQCHRSRALECRADRCCRVAAILAVYHFDATLISVSATLVVRALTLHGLQNGMMNMLYVTYCDRRAFAVSERKGDTIAFARIWTSEKRKNFETENAFYKPEMLLLVPKPELPELFPLPLPAMLYGSSSGIGILGRFLISNGRCTAEKQKKERKRKKRSLSFIPIRSTFNGEMFRHRSTAIASIKKAHCSQGIDAVRRSSQNYY